MHCTSFVNVLVSVNFFAARRSGSFSSGICRRIRVGQVGGQTDTLLEPAK